MDRRCPYENDLWSLERIITLKFELKGELLTCIDSIGRHHKSNVPNIVRLVYYV